MKKITELKEIEREEFEKYHELNYLEYEDYLDILLTIEERKKNPLKRITPKEHEESKKKGNIKHIKDLI